MQVETYVLEGQVLGESYTRKIRFLGCAAVSHTDYDIYITKGKQVVVQNSDKGITVYESFDDFLTTAEYWLSPDVISEVADAAGEDYVEDIE